MKSFKPQTGFGDNTALSQCLLNDSDSAGSVVSMTQRAKRFKDRLGNALGNSTIEIKELTEQADIDTRTAIQADITQTASSALVEGKIKILTNMDFFDDSVNLLYYLRAEVVFFYAVETPSFLPIYTLFYTPPFKCHDEQTVMEALDEATLFNIATEAYKKLEALQTENADFDIAIQSLGI
jgi:hypothetical protein